VCRQAETGPLTPACGRLHLQVQSVRAALSICRDGQIVVAGGHTCAANGLGWLQGRLPRRFFKKKFAGDTL
jgi:hypothetical protein